MQPALLAQAEIDTCSIRCEEFVSSITIVLRGKLQIVFDNKTISWNENQLLQ